MDVDDLCVRGHPHTETCSKCGGSELRWPQLPQDSYAMMGNRQQTVMIVPSQNVVLVRLGWTAGSYPMPENFADLLGEGAGR